MISIPINVNDSRFIWYLDLFWFAHQEIYQDVAYDKCYSLIIKDNSSKNIDLSIRHKLCNPWNETSLFDRLKSAQQQLCVPINMQIALQSILDEFDDSTVLELLDHDMFHFRPHSKIEVNDDQFLVCDVYENWHLYSLTKNKNVINPFLNPFQPNSFYNGGHVPIIGNVKTFKKILNDWINIHVEILLREYADTRQAKLNCWWAGMFSFNAACEINKVQMIAKNYCYIPGANNLTDEMYIGHYSVDQRFNKKKYPQINKQDFLDNEFYSMIKKWNKF